MLWIRRLNTLSAQPLAGTEGAAYPFWSPDSAFVAFISGGKLKKISAAGGEPLTLCDASFGAGGDWNRDDVILFTPKPQSPLYRVSASGGTPTQVATLDPASGIHAKPAESPTLARFTSVRWMHRSHPGWCCRGARIRSTPRDT